MKRGHDGHQVEVFTRALCGGCADLKARLAEAGIPFAEHDVATFEGRATAEWYDLPDVVPQLVVDGTAVEDVEMWIDDNGGSRKDAEAQRTATKNGGKAMAYSKIGKPFSKHIGERAPAGQKPPHTSGPPAGGPLVFDLEIERSPDEVGGWHDYAGMGFVCAVTTPLINEGTGGHTVYLREDLAALKAALEGARFVVGFNHVEFDYGILAGAGHRVCQRRNVDLSTLMGRGLDALCRENLFRGKKLDSANIPRMWQSGDEEERQAVIDECARHVALTRDLYHYALRWGGVNLPGGRWHPVACWDLKVWDMTGNGNDVSRKDAKAQRTARGGSTDEQIGKES